jgi:succinyl-CoA synthetase alpha subunit
MIVRRNHRVLVQGITGKQGTFWTERMLDYGTRIIGGTNPNRAGDTHIGLPVFGSAREAMDKAAFDVAVMFIPPAGALAAATDAIEAGAKLLVVLTEHIPLHDVMAMHAKAVRHGARIVGPNTAGLVTPGECFVGIMPAFNSTIFRPGRIGVISRSGSLGTLACLELVRGGLGQSAFIGIGGDPLTGTTTLDAVRAFENDAGTDAIVIIGEIGGAMEEEAAAHIAANRVKPAVAFIAGRSAPPQTRMGHAGAIVTGEAGSYAGKRKALEEAGIPVADTPGQLPSLLRTRIFSRQTRRVMPPADDAPRAP